MSSRLLVNAIPSGFLDLVRRQGHDGHGNSFAPAVDNEGGAPLRCCLRDSRPGEHIALIAYAPMREPGPYWEVGPVFVHGASCDGYTTPRTYPAGFRDRTQVLRAYRADQTIIGGAVVTPDEDQEEAAAALLSQAEVAFLHARNPVYGCFMFELVRPGGQPGG